MKRCDSGIGCGARARGDTHSTHPGGAGTPPLGHYDPGARSSLTVGA